MPALVLVPLLLPRWVTCETLKRMQWIGLVIALPTLAIAFGEGFIHSSPLASQRKGDAMGLTASMLWGLTTLTIRSSGLTNASPEQTLFCQLGVTTLVAPRLSLAFDETWSLA